MQAENPYICFILFKLLYGSWIAIDQNATSRLVQLNVSLQHFQHSILIIKNTTVITYKF